jgi:uncharacterized protein (DUF1684 family)
VEEENEMYRTAIASVMTGVLSATLTTAGPSSYDAAATEAWRTTRQQQLASADGWLTVSGLYFLKPGRNTIGGDPSSDVVLPGGSSPAAAGVIEYTPPRGVALLLNPGVTASAASRPSRSGSTC